MATELWIPICTNPKNNFIFCDLRIIVVIGIFHISSILFVSSAARKFTLQTRLLRILLTLFSQHYCLKCVYSELAKFLPSTYFQASDFKRNKKNGTKVEHVNEWNMGTEIFEIQCKAVNMKESSSSDKKSLVGSLWNENCFWRQHYHIWAIFLGGEIKCKIWYPCSSPLHSEILLAFHISLKCSSWLAKRQPKILKQRIVKQMTKLRNP